MLDCPGLRVNSRESGTTRAADVAGVVSDGTTDYVAGAWAWGTLSSVNAGEVVILHSRLPVARRPVPYGAYGEIRLMRPLSNGRSAQGPPITAGQ